MATSAATITKPRILRVMLPLLSEGLKPGPDWVGNSPLNSRPNQACDYSVRSNQTSTRQMPRMIRRTCPEETQLSCNRTERHSCCSRHTERHSRHSESEHSRSVHSNRRHDDHRVRTERRRCCSSYCRRTERRRHCNRRRGQRNRSHTEPHMKSCSSSCNRIHHGDVLPPNP